MLTMGTQVVSITVGRGPAMSGVLGYDDATNKIGLYDPATGSDLNPDGSERAAVVSFDAGESGADLVAAIQAGDVVTPVPVRDDGDGTATISFQRQAAGDPAPVEIATVKVNAGDNQPGPQQGPPGAQLVDLGDGLSVLVTCGSAPRPGGGVVKTATATVVGPSGASSASQTVVR